MTLITFKCKTLSPLFIGNANTKNAEFRPNVFKSSMRFWWRMLNPHLSTKGMLKEEAELFGGNYDFNDGKITKKPPFRIVDFDSSNLEITSNERPIDPRSDRANRANRGSAYYILSNQEFDISLYFSKNRSFDKIKDLFFLASALGGVGQRARRGAGAWKITGIEKDGEKYTDFDTEYTLNNISEKMGQINDNYEVNSTEKCIRLKSSKTIANIKSTYLKKISISSKDFKSQGKLRAQIMNAAHQMKDKRHFNSEIGGTSMASSVYISMLEQDESLHPIITTLHNQTDNDNLQKEFETKILNINE